jgi:uncharacterized membrane protein
VGRLWSRLVEGARRYLVAGILAFAPLAITIWAIAWIIERLDNLLLPRVLSLFLPAVQEPPRIPLLGAVFTLLVIILMGIVARHLFGGQLLRAWERLLSRVPVARNIYGGVKQLFEAIFSSDRVSRFNRVVLIEYPRKGIYAIAFTTGPARGPIQAATESHMINCFLPTTPNPTSGFYLLVPEQEVITVDLSVEEGFKLIMSAGLVTPGDPPTGEVSPVAGVGQVGPAAAAK